jgi:uncharacterized protein YbaR (Trm112 family)
VDKTLLALLVCPICKGNLTYDKKQKELICYVDRLAFPIQDDIPVMLEEEARLVTLEEKEAHDRKQKDVSKNRD